MTRVAKSLEALLSKIDERWPSRSKSADGPIGDIAALVNAEGVLRGCDLTNDPLNGLLTWRLAEALAASRDPRIECLISDYQICSGSDGPSPWVWRQYDGVNSYRHHMRVVVKDAPEFYDATTSWDIGKPSGNAKRMPLVEIGSTLWVQQKLNKRGAHLQEHGHEDLETQTAIRAFLIEKLKD